MHLSTMLKAGLFTLITGRRLAFLVLGVGLVVWLLLGIFTRKRRY